MTDGKNKGSYVKNATANLYLEAAKELGLRTDIVSEFHSVAKLSKNGRQLTVFKAFVGDDDTVAGVAAGDKALCSRLLGAAGLPAVEHRVFTIGPDDTDLVFRYAANRYPVVVKPTLNGLGRGVMINISNDRRLGFALRTLFRHDGYQCTPGGRRQFLVERFIPGPEYRILVCCDKVIDVLLKLKGRVLGDGHSDITALIDVANTRRRRNDTNFPLICDLRRIQLHLVTQGLTLRSVPPRGQEIELDSACLVDTGGHFKWMGLGAIAPENIEMFRNIARTLRLKLAGIDYVAADLAQPWHVQRCGILEVNTGVGMAIHVQAYPMDRGLAVPRQVLSCFLDR